MALARSRHRSPENIWPGFVDALATLLMVIMFLLTVFMLAQFFLSEALSGRDEVLARLERQISELSELLSLERQANTDLRLSIAQISDQLQSSTAERDTLSTTVTELAGERDALSASLAEMTNRAGAAATEAERVSTRLEDAFKVISADKEKIEIQLRQLASLERDIAALRALRKDLEAQVGTLAAKLEDRDKKVTALAKERTALRDRAKELEAKLSSERERTLLAQKEIKKRDVRLRELLARTARSDVALAEEKTLSARQKSRLDTLIRLIAELKHQLARVNNALEASEAKAEEQGVKIADLGRRLNMALARKVEELSRYRSEFFGRLRKVLGKQAGIRVVGDRFVFQSEVLFPSGLAELNPQGKEQLAGLARTLMELEKKIPADINWILRVDGHTDRAPISTAKFPSNWELSTARAITVVKFLAQNGIAESRLAATGFGEFQPLAKGNDLESYRRNRRIELKLTQR